MKVVKRKGWVKIQQMYENLDFDLDLKLLFMVTEAYYESGLLSLARFLLHLNTPFFLILLIVTFLVQRYFLEQKQASIRNKNSINKQKCYLCSLLLPFSFSPLITNGNFFKINCYINY